MSKIEYLQKRKIINSALARVNNAWSRVKDTYSGYEGSIESSNIDPLFQDLIDELESIQETLEEKE